MGAKILYTSEGEKIQTNEKKKNKKNKKQSTEHMRLTGINFCGN